MIYIGDRNANSHSNSNSHSSSNPIQSNSIQRLYLDGELHFAEEWRRAINDGLNMRVPRHSIGYMTRLFPREAGESFRKKSRQIALTFKISWSYCVIEVSQ
jgi:hypothetical protein